QKRQELLSNAGIVRNKLKINAAIVNAQLYLEVMEQQSFADLLWNYVDGKPIVNHWKTMDECPANTPLSDRISKDLKKQGWKFVGSTIIYAFMQAVGMVNDHLVDCPRHQEVQQYYR
ncbi:MAG: DNA-3-methyladenine glycosylase I, partial [Bacteroidota bacterium]